MPIPCNIRDREHKRFIESPTRAGETAVETVVSNTSNNPIPVDFTTRGEPKFIYNEVSSTGLGDITIINHTVLVGTGNDLTRISCSGENIGVYRLLINDVVIDKKRSYYTDYNVKFDLNEIEITESDNVKIIVENRNSSSADFNATLYYNEYNL
jgi:hypothetical protein